MIQSDSYSPISDRYSIKKVWKTPQNHLACVTKNHSVPYLCGYVGVNYESPLFGLPYVNYLQKVIRVHGGLTYSSSESSRYASPDNKSVYPILEVNNLWWFGFDCGHLYDSPSVQTLDYCINECNFLSKQLTQLSYYLNSYES